METMNPTHFQSGIQIMHYADILHYCTGSHIAIVADCYCYFSKPKWLL